jgi:hypothetical protein
MLYKYGIRLSGPNPKELIKPVNLEEVKRASKSNLLDEWQPKINDPEAFKSPDYNTDHLRAYAVLTMCRILYTAKVGEFVSKKTAASWVKKTYAKKWGDLVKKAENWSHGKKMDAEKQIQDLIKFTINEIG